jgi:hypothetical protein
MPISTKELIARRLFTVKIRDYGYSRHEARLLVFWKTGIAIPYNESKKLSHDALVMSVFI